MATAKKTGFVERVKDALSGMFSSNDDAKTRAGGATPKSAAKAANGGKAAKTAKAGKTAKAKSKPPVAKGPARTEPRKKVASPQAAAKKTAAKASATSMDRKLIALSEPYEVRDWSASLGCTEAELKAAVKAVGNSADKVRAHLKKR